MMLREVDTKGQKVPVTEISSFSPPEVSLEAMLPAWTRTLGDLQTAIPELAKNPKRLGELDSLLAEIPTVHRSVLGDARYLSGLFSP
jgi:hypothetical protein